MPAPKGNKNALKHGLYSRRNDQITLKEAGETPLLDVSKEIAIGRYVLEQILKDLETVTVLDDKSKLYNSFFNGMTSLNTTIRTHALLTGQDPEHDKQMEIGAEWTRQKLGINFYLSPPKQVKPKSKKKG